MGDFGPNVTLIGHTVAVQTILELPTTDSQVAHLARACIDRYRLAATAPVTAWQHDLAADIAVELEQRWKSEIELASVKSALDLNL